MVTRKEIKARLTELEYVGRFTLRATMCPFTGNKVLTVTLLECGYDLDFAAIRHRLKPAVCSFKGPEIVGSMNGWPIFKKVSDESCMKCTDYEERGKR